MSRAMDSGPGWRQIATVPIPRSVLFYGLLGLLPFLVPPLLALWVPPHAGFLGVIVLGYGALILSFLGGARWGLEVARPAPRFVTISLSMLPTLAGLALLLLPGVARPVQLLAMAVLLALQLWWDVNASTVPSWYGRLRLILTVGAAAGLVAMAALSARAPIDPATMI